MQKYSPIFQQYDTAQQIPTNCNSITFINAGTSIVYLENVTLQPNQSFSIDGNYCEYTEQVISMRFSPYDPDLQNNLIVVKKVYL
jgi:hypothetical protein